MWRVILLVFCYHVVSQPVTDETQIRHTRELIECCPCPGSSHGGQDTLARSFDHSEDDCPCRLQSADSEGASLMLFPIRTAGNPINSVSSMRSNDSNDMKNLLEPEVGLATSMLQTLREATEEEYQDALVRDAMRSSDAVPEESARNVVIIVKPRATDDEDDFVSEASNIKEARCINHVSSPLGKMRTVSNPLRTLPDFLRLPKAKQQSFMPRNLWDMDSNLGASNVQEKVLGTDGKTTEFKPRSPLFKLRTPLKENKLKSFAIDDVLKTPPIFKLENTFKNRPNFFERFDFPLIPKTKVDSTLRKANGINDLRPATSSIHRLIEKEDGKGSFMLNKGPLMLKNILKLKDVELVPKTIPRTSIFRSKLNNKNIPSTLARDDNSNIDCKDTTNESTKEKVLLPKTVSRMATEKFNTDNISNEDLDPQNIASVIELEKDHQDAITSPSDVIPNVLGNIQTNTVEPNKFDCSNLSSEEIMPTNTHTISEDLDDSEKNDDLDPAVESEIYKITNNEDDCNTGISKTLQDGELNDALDPTVESEINEFTEHEDGSNTSESSETNQFSESGVEGAESDTDSTNDVTNSIPFTSQESSYASSQNQTLEHVTIPTDNADEDFISENISDKTHSIDPQSELINNVKPISLLSETLSTLKDNVRKSFENLKKTTANINPALPQENSKNSHLRADTPIIEDLYEEPQNNELVKEPDNSTEKENLFSVTFKDLQKLSDDLLVLSSNKEQKELPKEIEDEDNAKMVDFQPNKVQEKAAEIEPDSFTEPTDKTEVAVPKKENLEFTKDRTCHVDFKPKTNVKSAQEFKSVIQNVDKKDMSVEASSPVANTFSTLLDPLGSLNLKPRASLLNRNPLDPFDPSEKLGSPISTHLDPLNINEKFRSPLIRQINLNEKFGSALLDPLNLSEKFINPTLDPLNMKSYLQDFIVQPTVPDDPLKFLEKPMAEVLKLPTLEDLKERLSSVFDNNDRSAENNFSDEDSDCTNVTPVEMAPTASTTTLKKVPSLRPLEDMNVDIFQLNPLSKPDLFSNAPRLNLNNFRAKLPIPNNLDLKPVKLESRVANNKGNILGAALTFGKDKINLRKSKLNHSNLLDRPLGTFPNLDELRSSFQSDTYNLLGTTLQPNLDLFRDSSLKTSGIPDINEIRRNTEKTMKGLQQRIKSTFKGGNVNPLSEKFAKPQDLLEDVNDKLKAIHYDLNDRLSSIHDDILDQSRLKHLAIPVLPSFPTNRNANSNIMNNIRNRGKPARLQTSASTISSQEIDPLGNINGRTLLRSPVKSSPKRMQANQKPLLGAESAPVVTKVEFPKSKITVKPRKFTLSPSPLLPSMKLGSGNAFPQNIREKPLVPSQPGFVEDMKRPIFRKSSPFKDKNGKVTITFATTTASPVTSPISQFKTTSSVKGNKLITDIKQSGDSLKERMSLPKSKTFVDGKQSASELKPSKMLTPAISKNNFKTAHSNTKDLHHFQNLDSIENINSRLSGYKRIKDSKLRLNEHNANKLNSAWEFDNSKPEALTEKTKVIPLVWPKSGEDSFLAKVREAMQARLNSFRPVKVAKNIEVAEAVSKTDMSRSASVNNDVMIEEALKENIPYKCRMVCTKE